MSKFPKWFTIKNWNSITLEKAQFVHQQASLCYADQLDGYKGLKSRCELLFGLCVTIITALATYVTSIENIEHNPIAAVVMIVGYFITAMVLWKNLFGFIAKSEGQAPSRLLNKEYFEGQPCENMIISETISIQIKIDDIEDVKVTLSRTLGKALIAFALTPVIAAIVSIYFLFCC